MGEIIKEKIDPGGEFRKFEKLLYISRQEINKEYPISLK